MPLAIYALMAVNFAIGTQTFVFAGLIADLAADLQVPLGSAGLLIAAGSVTFAIGAPLAAIAVFKQERRRVMLIGLGVLALSNLAATIAPDFWSLLSLRIIGGAGTAFAGSLVTVSVAALVPPEKRGQAFALVVGGLTVAFILGIPAGTAIGGYYGWRSTFGFGACVIAGAIALVVLLVPRLPPEPAERPDLTSAFSQRAVNRYLAMTFVGFVSLFTIMAYQGPVITHATGITGSGIGSFQLFIGIGSIVGLAVGGRLASRNLTTGGIRAVFGLLALAATGFWAILSAPSGSSPAIFLAALIFLGSAAIFTLVPMTLTRLSAIAGALLPVVLPLNGSLVALGQGVGAGFGALLTETFGFSSIGIGGLIVGIIGLRLSFSRLQ